MLKQYLLKTGITAVGLAALFYSGCSSVPSRINDWVQLKKYSSSYSSKDKIYSDQVKLINAELVKHNDSKKIDLEILVDDSFIEKYQTNGWWTNFSKVMDSVDKRFNKKFGIDFEIDSVKYMKIPDHVPEDLGSVIAWMRLYYKPGKFDAFVFLTGKRHDYEGACKLLGHHLIAAPGKRTHFLERILQHELSHLFDARDLENSKTIMAHGLKWSFKWSKKNSHRINNSKNRVWYYCNKNIHTIKEAILELPEEDQFNAEKVVYSVFGFRFHREGFKLAKKLLKKYPDNEFLKFCHDEIFNIVFKKKE